MYSRSKNMRLSFFCTLFILFVWKTFYYCTFILPPPTRRGFFIQSLRMKKLPIEWSRQVWRVTIVQCTSLLYRLEAHCGSLRLRSNSESFRSQPPASRKERIEQPFLNFFRNHCSRDVLYKVFVSGVPAPFLNFFLLKFFANVTLSAVVTLPFICIHFQAQLLFFYLSKQWTTC